MKNNSKNNDNRRSFDSRFAHRSGWHGFGESEKTTATAI